MRVVESVSRHRINRELLEEGAHIILFPEGECVVEKVNTCGALIKPLAKKERKFTAFKSKNPAIKSKDEVEVTVATTGRAFYISATSEVTIVE